jgi:hypothetical protein
LPLQKRSVHSLSPWVLGLILVIFLGHFTLVLVHQFGKDRLPYAITDLSERYIVPWFYQNYLMFAPDPTDHINTFIYRVETQDGWSQWKNPVFPHQQDHWANRLGTGSDWYDLYNGLGDLLFNAAMSVEFNPNAEVEDYHATRAYGLARRAVLRLESDISGVQIAVFTEHHRVSTDGKVQVRQLVQPYPPEAL